MSNFSKWLGAGIGFAAGGPIGAIIGFVAGTVIDAYSKEDFERIFGDGFEVGDLQNVDHQTPFNTTQNFNFVQLKLQKD